MDIETKIIVGGVALLVLFLGGFTWCSYSECGALCRRNGDELEFTWTQGCYCADDKGVYNPKDSREGIGR